MKLLDEIRSTVTGAAILADWIGADGVPVPDWQAEARSEVCEHCPFNVEPGWWDGAKTAVAETVRQHLRVKHKLGFRVRNEDKLGICKICECVTPLKIHVPISHIKARTTPETLAKFPKTNCWVKAEIEGSN